jgi:hypothetical protein
LKRRSYSWSGRAFLAHVGGFCNVSLADFQTLGVMSSPLIFPARSIQSQASINFAAMRHPKDDDEEHAVMDLIDDAEVADADPVGVLSGELDSLRGARLFAERQDPRLEPLLCFPGELSKLPIRGRSELDAVPRQRPSSRKSFSAGTVSFSCISRRASRIASTSLWVGRTERMRWPGLGR